MKDFLKDALINQAYALWYHSYIFCPFCWYDRLTVGKTIGEGAFGKVVIGEAVGIVCQEKTSTVAVKMLKGEV